jgi:hypothetical protein
MTASGETGKDGKPVMVPVMMPAKEVVQHSTTIRITLPTGELTHTVKCHVNDVFSKSEGRRFALLGIIAQDNEGAHRKAEQVAMKAAKGTGLEAGSLFGAAKKYYMLSREDRKLLFKAICPDLFHKSPEQVALRKAALFLRLKKTFDPMPEPQQKLLYEQLRAKFDPKSKLPLRKAAK